MAFADKAKNLFKRRAFMFKLLLSIVVFICIPLITLLIIFSRQSTDEFQKSNHESNLSVLHSTANTFSTQERILSQVALRMSLDDTIRKPLRHTATEYSEFAAAEALKNYGSEVLYVDHVGVYYASKGYLLVNGCKYTLQDWCCKVSSSDSVKADELVRFFNNLQTMDYFAVHDGQTLLAARPVSLGAAGKDDAVAFFCIDAKAMEQSYSVSAPPSGSFAIINSQGNYLIQGSGFESEISNSSLSTFFASGQDFCTAGSDNQFLLYQYQDPASDFVFLLSVSKFEAEQKLVEFATQIRTTMFMALLLVCLSLTITIYINYRPIYHLLKRHSPAEDKHEVRTELERLDSAFFALDERMSTQTDLLNEFMLGDLLFSNRVDRNLVRKYFADGQYQSYAVATALCTPLTSVQTKNLTERIESETECIIHITRIPYRPQTIIICLSRNMINPHSVQEGIFRAILSFLGEECFISMGTVVTDICELRSSYRSSLTANSDPYAEEFEMGSKEFTVKCQSLVQCVYVGDETEATMHLRTLEEFIYTKIPSDGLRRYYGYKLINTYLTGISSSDARLSSKDAELILSFSSIRHLFILLQDSIHQVCSKVSASERTLDLHLQQRLLSYVNENFCNRDLCLTTAADHLGTSIYVVSRLFKEITGRGFKDYVTEKRLEYGHTLLSTTQSSITEIAAAAGFESSNYFSAVFKSKYGLPPTKYKKSLEEKQ